MLLRFAEDARLYVPLERIDLVQSYRVVEGSEPHSIALRQHRLDFPQSAASANLLEDMADRLLLLYAQRKTAEGFAFSPDVRLAARI